MFNNNREFFEYVAQKAVYTGLKLNEYYNMTLKEAEMYIVQFNLRQKNEAKQQAILLYRHADMIASKFTRKSVMNIYDFFPDLFDKPEEKQNNDNWKVFKAKMIQYALEHNKNIKKKAVSE